MSVHDDVNVIEIKDVDDELVEAWHHLMPQLSTTAEAPDAEVLQEVLDTSRLFMAVTDSGECVGSATLVVYRTPSGRRAHIDDVVVAESMRGRGLGRRLSQVLIEEAERARARTIELTSRPSRVAANQLYESLGFEKREANLYRYNSERAEKIG